MKSLVCLLVSCLFATVSPSAIAEDFPVKPLTVVVPFGVSGTTDLLTRLLAGEMSKKLGQPVVILNKGGGGGIIGATEVAKAKNDGYMLGMLPVGPLTTQPNLHRVGYGPESFDYVCLVYANPQILIVPKRSRFNTVADLIAFAKANPGKLNYGSSGIGSVPHLAAVAMAKAAGIDAFHVPYKGEADELAGVLGGDVAFFVGHPTFLVSHPDALRGLAVMAPSRLKEFPNIPTLTEQGIALNFDVWGGLVVPKGVPAPAVEALENACKAGTSSEEFRKRMDALHTPVKYADGKSFSSFVAAEFERNGRLLRESGIQKD